MSSGISAARFRLCRSQSVMSCCPGGFLHSSCFRFLCSSCTSETSCRTFIMSFAPWAIILYASTSVRLSAVHCFLVMESISRTVCMRVIIPLLQFPVHTLPASVHVFSSCRIPVSSFARSPSSVSVCPLAAFLKCVTKSCSALLVCSLMATTLSCVQLLNACDCESVAPHR